MRVYVKVVLAACLILGLEDLATAAGDTGVSSVRLVPALQSTSVAIGEHFIDVNVADTGTDVTFIRLHENEMPAGAVGTLINREVPSRFIDLSQGRNRNITFTLTGSHYSFDPNTIFTIGVAPSALGVSLSPAATQATNKLAATITSLLLPNAPVIALHNNRGTLLESYASGPFKKCTHRVYVNPEMDSSTFAVVATQSLFETIKHLGINVIWENRAGTNDDGSLLAFAQRNNIPYVNIETGLGSSIEPQLNIVRQMVPILRAVPAAGAGVAASTDRTEQDRVATSRLSSGGPSVERVARAGRVSR
jgi:hypothetical protein